MSAQIQNAHLLTDIFDRWPSFHDAEVVSVDLDRIGPTLTASIHLWRTLTETDDKGYFKQADHTLAKLRFTEVVLESLSVFNHQNVLNHLEILDFRENPFESPIDEFPQRLERMIFRGLFHESYGLRASFACRGIEVVSVEAMPDELRLGPD